MIAQTPQEGQPLDLQYISNLAQSVIDLNKQISSKTYSNTYVKNQDDSVKYDRTSNSSFYAAFQEIVTNKTISPGYIENFTYTFTHTFTHAPVVTVTPVNFGKTNTGKTVNVVISEVTPGSVTGYIKFNNTTAGTASVGINIIAIGFNGNLTS